MGLVVGGKVGDGFCYGKGSSMPEDLQQYTSSFLPV